MARPREITDEKKLLIALMHSERGMTNQAIADEIDISPSAVSKIIRDCFKEGRLRLVFNRDGLSVEELSSLKTMVAGTADLKRRLAVFKKDSRAIVQEPDVRVFDSGSSATTPAGWAARLEVFGRAAAPYIGDLVANARVVGTSWGETFASIVRALGERPPGRPRRPIQFFGLCGEMLEGPPRKASASSLAHQLDQIVNGDPQHSHSCWLAGVPSRMPQPSLSSGPKGDGGLTERECDAVEKYIHLLPGYRRVFGADQPLIDRADLILTSCGPKERPLGYGGVQELRSAGLSLREARRLLVGDISGFLLKDPAVADPDGRIKKINDRLISPGLLKKLGACSKKALDGQAGGTVLCCCGANKVDAVLEIVRLGLAARLVLDMDLATELQRRL